MIIILTSTVVISSKTKNGSHILNHNALWTIEMRYKNSEWHTIYAIDPK